MVPAQPGVQQLCADRPHLRASAGDHPGITGRTDRRLGVRLSRALSTVAIPTTADQGRRPGRMFMHRQRWASTPAHAADRTLTGVWGLRGYRRHERRSLTY
jgi:hypothetical protein